MILQQGKDVVSTLKVGDSFGEEWLLLGGGDAGKSARGEVAQQRYVAVTGVMCMVLAHDEFEKVARDQHINTST